MTLTNKFGIDDAAELARVEERISKRNALKLFTSGRLENFPAVSHIGRGTCKKNKPSIISTARHSQKYFIPVFFHSRLVYMTLKFVTPVKFDSSPIILSHSSRVLA